MDRLNIFQQSSSVSILGLIVLAILLYFILKFLKKYLPVLPKKEKYRKLFKRQIQAIELIVWFLFISVFAHKIFTTNVIISLIIIILLLIFVIFFGWFEIKNLVAGISFKLHHNIKINDSIKFKDITGVVKEIGNQNLEVETNNGEIYFIPFSKIKENLFCKLSNAEQSYMYVFDIKIATSKYNNSILSDIKKYLLTFSSVSTTKEPNVKIAETTSETTTLTISFVSLDDNNNDKIKMLVKERFEN